MVLSLLGNIITDCNNWIKGWDDTTFAIVLIVLIGLMAMFTINLFKGFLASKFKFRYFSFFFLAIVLFMLIYICTIK